MSMLISGKSKYACICQTELLYSKDLKSHLLLRKTHKISAVKSVVYNQNRPNLNSKPVSLTIYSLDFDSMITCLMSCLFKAQVFTKPSCPAWAHRHTHEVPSTS